MALNSIFKFLFVHTRLGSWIKAQVLAASGKHASELIANGCRFFCLDRQYLCFAFNDHSFLPNLWFHEGSLFLWTGGLFLHQEIPFFCLNFLWLFVIFSCALIGHSSYLHLNFTKLNYRVLLNTCMSQSEAQTKSHTRGGKFYLQLSFFFLCQIKEFSNAVFNC